MPYAQLNQLDFNNIKASLKEYLRANSDFDSYDFEGSALSNLLDLLAYNTYYTAFNANLVANEMFLDSATLRDNVVSIAKSLGYTPKSATSAFAEVNFNVNFTGPAPTSITLERGTGFLSELNDSTYNFVVLGDTKATVNNGIAQFSGIRVHEGTLITQTITVNTNFRNQRFVITNQNVDSSTIRVRVFGNNYPNGAYDLYELSDNILNVTPTSRVFYVQEVEDENYEIIFGDGILGKKLENGNVVEISYLVTNSDAVNGAKQFSFAGRLFDTNGNSNYAMTVDNISVQTAATGGEKIETMRSIKFNAAKTFGSQNRAVTTDDFSSIIHKIYPSIADIIVYGGEDEEPPEFGVVKIAIKPKASAYLSSSVKKSIEKSLKDYTVASVTPRIVDPSIIYVEMNSEIFFDPRKTTYNGEKIKQLVIANLERYISTSDTEKFNGKFRYSKFISVIDEADQAINSNLTKVIMRKDFYPALNSKFYYEICYKNPFFYDDVISSLSSTGFVVREFPNDTVYLEDRDGTIVLYKIDPQTSNKIVLNKNQGIINYAKGEIQLFDLIIIKGSFDDDKIELRVKPAINDIVSTREMYLDVDIAKSNFTVIQE